MENNQKNIKHTVKDFLVSGESFDLVHDETRDLLVTFPQPKEDQLAKYYESEAYISHTDTNKGLTANLYQSVKKYSLASKTKLIKSLLGSTGTLLDIGAGTGEFLKVAKENNWTVSGIEPNEKARGIASEKGIDLENSIDDLQGNVYDVVTLWHVLEHLPDLENTLQKIEAFVKPGGVLIIAVPNFKSYDATFYKNYWAAFDVPRHLWHFSKASMKTLFSSEVTLQKIKPMWFDSFYVSLLSEKYKSGTNFSIKALFVGLWSNLVGLRTKDYSSHIYCFKKAK
ncbi:class I SAM-dependent methyltransferase [Ulvibacter litoralis]|uniref:Methyltransferase domain-containing protein n=1 Tax=Ulvibacter litoralis TaxID=227084 RepID=A0A1G7D9U4_9FLAO|nr:class I SAM-dependent methyltransferase [Ulvibacter litoralis]GHC44362.1 methyltransferase [Ulvibacter litoralis]SDE48283.1 Methyltransferase domain-containing protein [Ulvibacter litoralis]